MLLDLIQNGPPIIDRVANIGSAYLDGVPPCTERF